MCVSKSDDTICQPNYTVIFVILYCITKSRWHIASEFNTIKYMKKYSANEELVALLEKNNFVERNTIGDSIKGKRRFKVLGSAYRELLLDNDQMIIYDKEVVQLQTDSLTEEELRLLILFFKLKREEVEELTEGLPFEFSKAFDRIHDLSKEFCIAIVLKLKDSQSKSARLIMNAYNGVKL